MSNNKQSSVNKEFVPYEEALSLKKLGFNEPCFGYFNTTPYLGIGSFVFKECDKNTIDSYGNKPLLRPTFSQAFRWFREKYNLPSNLELFHVGWDYVIYLDITEEVCPNEGSWNTYEEAELACLKNLIKIQGGNNEQQ